VVERVQASLLSAVSDLVHWLDAARVPFMVIGGVAASVLGRPRLTQDIDALAILPEERWLTVMNEAAQFGIVARVQDPLEFAHRSRVLLMKHVASDIDIDVTFGGLPFEHAAVENSDRHNIEGLTVRLPRVEDLLIMKAIARRPKDLQDIEGLLEAHPNADVAKVRQWVREFSVATGMADMLEQLDKLLAARKS
jgi:predicted nucleotidyltransferase